MCDPVSLIGLAAQLTAICGSVISYLKQFAEHMVEARDDLREVLAQVEKVKRMLGLLQITLKELQGTNIRDMEFAINRDAWESTMKDLVTLAGRTVGPYSTIGFRQRFNWARYKSIYMAIIIKLKEQENDVMNVLIVINTTSSLRTQKEVEELARKTSANFQIQSAFQRIKFSGGRVTNTINLTRHWKVIKTWLGQVVQDEYSDELYLAARQALSEAAYWGRWEDLLKSLDIGYQQYGEDWVNAVRIKPTSTINTSHFWTPLHQAVYNSAPSQIIQELLARGASRMIRSKGSDFAHKDMTPLELAQELGFTHLFGVLSPTLHISVPQYVVSTLQRHFHDLIRMDLVTKVDVNRMRMPELEVSLEFGEQPVWFPVVVSHGVCGYIYQFDRRELLVKSYNISALNEEYTYRITIDGCIKIDEALIFVGDEGI